MSDDYIPTEKEEYDLECLEKCRKCIHWKDECMYGGMYCAFEDTLKMCMQCECRDDCDGIEYMSKWQCEKKRGLQ